MAIYVCGDGRRMAPAVRELLGQIYQEATGASEAEVQRFAADVERRGRYVADVFSYGGVIAHVRLQQHSQHSRTS